jgi:hypothetical protein
MLSRPWLVAVSFLVAACATTNYPSIALVGVLGWHGRSIIPLADKDFALVLSAGDAADARRTSVLATADSSGSWMVS